MSDRAPNPVDRAAGLASTDPLFALREARPAFLAGTEACRRSVIAPADDQGLAPELRQAIALRVVQAAGAGTAAYAMPQDAALAALAAGDMPDDARLGAIARHVDLITAEPGRADAASLDALAQAGLSTPQIVALSELIGFLAFEVRLVAGLRAMGGTS